MAIDEITKANLINHIREASLSRLKIHSTRENIRLAELPHEPLVFAHWMSFILAAGPSLRITFKVHYMTEAAKFFAANTYRTSKEKISQSQALDFFREFCNLTMGQMKIVLAGSKIKVGVSLPIMARGFDEIFYPRPKNSILNYWSLSCEEEKVFCSTQIEVHEDFVLQKDWKKNSDADLGQVEFL